MFLAAGPATEFTERAMVPASDYATYSLGLGPQSDQLRYFLRVGDTRWPADRQYYTIHVVARPGLEKLQAAYSYPRYTAKAADTQTIQGPIAVLAGTKVRLTAFLQRPVTAALFERRDQPAVKMEGAADGRSWSADFEVRQDGGYCIMLLDPDGRVIQRLPDSPGPDGQSQGYGQAADNSYQGYYGIKAIADAPPKVAFLQPAADTLAPPGGKVAMRIKVEDDYGLSAAGLSWGVKGQPPQVIDLSAQAAGKADAVLACAWISPPPWPKGRC